MNTLPYIEHIEHIESLFKQTEKFSDKEGKLFVPKILESIDKIDSDLVKLLLSDEKAKEQFFMKVEDVYVLKQNELIEFFTMNEYFNHSFTSYTNKIGLIKKDSFIKKFDDVVLAFPYKDCVLEGGQTKDDEKNNEVFYNSIISRDEVDRLLEPKVLTNIKRFDKEGEHEVEEIGEEENLIIKGNNLLALHSLKKRYAGKVKLIYIDPPYNTDTDSFMYNDSFSHSTWLTFMKNRLEIAREFLSDDGLIFVQCDDIEQAYLKVLMDEIFGRKNFINQISVKMSEASGKKMAHVKKRLPKVKESILFYKKNSISLNSVKINKEEWDNEYNILLENFEKKDKEIIDTIIESQNITDKEISLVDKILSKVESKSVSQKLKELKIKEKDEWVEKNSYRIIRTTASDSVKKLVDEKKKINKNKFFTVLSTRDKLLYFAKSDYSNTSKSPRVQLLFAEDYLKVSITDLWSDIVTTGLEAEGQVVLKNGKKPENLIERILKLSTNPNDLVLDFHLGSGTTCAVAHKMGRRYIGIEQMDYIEDIAVERMKKVIEGEQGGISKAIEWKGGGSFIYAELKSIDNFANTPISRLNKNMQYLPISEIEDEEYGVSEEEIAVNKKFYGLNDE